MSDFVPGHRLSAALDLVVAPALGARLPGLRVATALIGHGSDVLGFDTPRSQDHDWGPRLQVVLADADADRADLVLDVVEAALPEAVLGVPVDLLGSMHRDWPARQAALVAALVELGRRHDALGLAVPVRAEPSAFFTRPFTVVWADRFVDALHEAISDPAVAALPHGIGGLDAVSDNTLVLGRHGLRAELAGLWQSPELG